MLSNSGKDVRILPAVIGVCAILFALKAGGFAFSASAAQTEAPAAAKPAAAAAKVPDSTKSIAAARAIPKIEDKQSAAPATAGALPTDLEGGVSAAQMDVLTSLSERRDALEERQRQLDLQANILAATEKRVDQKINELKTIQAKIESVLDQRDGQDAAQLDALVRVYTAMKPKDAARIFEKLDGEVRIAVAGKLKPDVMAGLLSNLPADVAQKLTVELANRYRLPAGLPAAAAAATAPQAVPAPASPTPQQGPPKAGG